MLLSACWRSKSSPARFSAASAETSCALACSTALSSAVTWRPMRSMVACWVAILRARGIDRDAVVAVVDAEDDVARARPTVLSPGRIAAMWPATRAPSMVLLART